MIVVLNLTGSFIDSPLDININAQLVNIFTGEEVTLSNQLNIKLAPGEFIVLEKHT